MEQNKKKFSLQTYAFVSQLVVMLICSALGGYLLGKYVFFKTTIAAGIMATIGALSGIIYFIMQIIRLGKKEEKESGEGNQEI